MARLLVWNALNDPDTQRGDIVYVYADGQKPGKSERSPLFLILEIDDPYTIAKHLSEADYRDLGGDAPEMVNRYRFRYPVETIPVSDAANFHNNVISAIHVSIADIVDKQAF